MARTFRNKKTVPVGWTVRDDGRPYFNGDDPWGRGLRLDNNHFRCPRYRRRITRCEPTEYRRLSNRAYRTRTNRQVRLGRWEDILPPTGTEGWLYW